MSAPRGSSSRGGPAEATLGTGRHLSGRTVVVTRATSQAGRLRALLEARGASVVEVPTVAIRELVSARGRLIDALGRGPDWLVVTSSNGARILLEVLDGAPWSGPVAAVGPGTAEALTKGGLHVELVPERFVGEALVEAFPVGPGSVVLIQAEGARAVVATGLDRKGWAVEQVTAYRTVSVGVPEGLRRQCEQADAITFTSASTVTGFVASAGLGGLPPIVVCIGPVTERAAVELGVVVTAVASPHDLEGLVEAVVRSLTS